MRLTRYIQIESRRQATYERLFAKEILKAFKKNAEMWIDFNIVGNAVGEALEKVYRVTLEDYLSRQWEQLDGNVIQKKERFFMPASATRIQFRCPPCDLERATLGSQSYPAKEPRAQDCR